MARFETSAGIDELTGQLDKRSDLTMRRKAYHYPNGKIFGYGPKEVFKQEKRDYKRAPRTPAEQVQHRKWTDVCQDASQIEKNKSHLRHQEMVTRFTAQLYGKPDPLIAPKRIPQFGNFIRSILAHE